jgi:hypothetical protein
MSQHTDTERFEWIQSHVVMIDSYPEDPDDCGYRWSLAVCNIKEGHRVFYGNSLDFLVDRVMDLIP